ncbi:MAG: hypothetical protein V2B20_13515 [Pseudomonadota bacterium]
MLFAKEGKIDDHRKGEGHWFTVIFDADLAFGKEPDEGVDLFSGPLECDVLVNFGTGVT